MISATPIKPPNAHNSLKHSLRSNGAPDVETTCECNPVSMAKPFIKFGIHVGVLYRKLSGTREICEKTVY